MLPSSGLAKPADRIQQTAHDVRFVGDYTCMILTLELSSMRLGRRAPLRKAAKGTNKQLSQSPHDLISSTRSSMTFLMWSSCWARWILCFVPKQAPSTLYLLGALHSST